MCLKTPLYDVHVAMGAKMAPFGGWDMPIQYTSIVEEHTACRTKAALFDICHMGEFFVYGPNALNDLNKLFTCELSTLAIGRCRYGFLLNEQGGTQDDLITYRLSEEKFMVVVNAGTRENDAKWISARLSPDTKFDEASSQVAKLDLQGPASAEALQPICEYDLKQMKYYTFVETKVLGKRAIVSRTGYTGEYGFEIYIDVEMCKPVWDALLATGVPVPAGLGARDTLRLECGLPLYGHEMNDTMSPVASGLTFAIAKEKENYIGRDVVMKELAEGTPRKLVGLQLTTKQSGRNGQSVLCGDKVVGTVTSGSLAPSLGYAIAFAYVDKDYCELGTKLAIDNGRKLLEAEVVPTPFYKEGTARRKTTA